MARFFSFLVFCFCLFVCFFFSFFSQCAFKGFVWLHSSGVFLFSFFFFFFFFFFSLYFSCSCLGLVFNVLFNHKTTSKYCAYAYMTCEFGAWSVPSHQSHVTLCFVGPGSVSSRLFVISRDVPLPQNFLPFLCVGIDFIKKNFDPSKPLFPTFFNSSNFTTQFHNGGSSGVRRGDRYRSWYDCRINNLFSTSFLDI